MTQRTRRKIDARLKAKIAVDEPREEATVVDLGCSAIRFIRMTEAGAAEDRDCGVRAETTHQQTYNWRGGCPTEN